MPPTHCSEPSAPVPAPGPGHRLTQLVKVGLGTTRARHRAQQPGLEERAPFAHQHALATEVILGVRVRVSLRLHGDGPPSCSSTLTIGGRGTDAGFTPVPRFSLLLLVGTGVGRECGEDLTSPPPPGSHHADAADAADGDTAWATIG